MGRRLLACCCLLLARSDGRRQQRMRPPPQQQPWQSQQQQPLHHVASSGEVLQQPPAQPQVGCLGPLSMPDTGHKYACKWCMWLTSPQTLHHTWVGPLHACKQTSHQQQPQHCLVNDPLPAWLLNTPPQQPAASPASGRSRQLQQSLHPHHPASAGRAGWQVQLIQQLQQRWSTRPLQLLLQWLPPTPPPQLQQQAAVAAAGTAAGHSQQPLSTRHVAPEGQLLVRRGLS